MTISVIIATFNRSALLAECLAHLARQRFEPGDEIVVVDNGSTDGTARVLSAAAVSMPVPLRCLFESAPGKSRAIARALSVAAGDLLVFTDDDVNVEDGWLPAVRRTMGDPAVALMGGPVVARWEREPPKWLRSASNGSGRLASPLALLNYGTSPIELGDRTVLGANMAVRRDAFTRAGGFPSHLGKLRGTLLSGEDHELCRRVQRAGLRAVYDPAAAVRHWVPADRMRLGYYVSWFYWSGVTHSMLDRGEPAGRTAAGVPLYLVRRAAAGVVRGLAAVALGRMREGVECAIDVAFAVGYARHRLGHRLAAPVASPVGGQP